MEIPMPDGRSEVFRARGCEAERLPRGAHSFEAGWRNRVGEGYPHSEGGPSGAESRCRNGAGADGIRVRTSASTAEPGPGRIFDADTLARRR